MNLPLQISSKKHIVFIREKIAHRRLSLIISAIAGGFIFSFVLALVLLELKNSGFSSLLNGAFLLPWTVLTTAVAIILYLKWAVKNPIYRLEKGLIIMGRRVPLSFLTKPVVIKAGEIKDIKILIRPNGNELLIKGKKGKFIWFPLVYEESPSFIKHIIKLSPKKSNFVDGLNELLDSFISTADWKKDKKKPSLKNSFLFQWGFYITFIKFTINPKNQPINSNQQLLLYKTMRNRFDIIRIHEFIPIFKLLLPNEVLLDEDNLRSSLVIGMKSDIAQGFKNIDDNKEGSIPRKLLLDWKSNWKHGKLSSPPLGSMTSRILSGKGNEIKISPDKNIETTEGTSSLDNFAAMRSIDGFAGIKEIHLIDIMGKKMVFNRNCHGSTYDILMAAPHIWEVTIAPFQFMGIATKLKKFLKKEIGKLDKEQ
jgi:hypothetical protein